MGRPNAELSGKPHAVKGNSRGSPRYGGFAEGSWKQEGNKWLINFTSTALDGTTASAQHVVTHIDDKKFTWESINRQSGGEVLPNIDKIEVVRVAGQ